MYPESLHEIYFKFSSKPDINKKILQNYPPNNQQQLICKRLNVPFNLWSFYLFKKESIYSSLVLNREKIISIFTQNVLYIHNMRFINYKYSQFQDMDLTEEEKFFIFYHVCIYDFYEDGFCFKDTFPSLQNLCFHTILKSKPINRSFKIWLPYFPKLLFSQLQDELEVQCFNVPMPKYRANQTKFKLYDEFFMLENLFSEVDTKPFTKEFVVWFQKEPNVYQQFQPNGPIKIVFFNFKRLEPAFSTTYKFCVRCMKRCWEKYAPKIGLARYYFLIDTSYSDQMKKLKNPRYWCARCKRTPLFQVLNPEKYLKQYGNESTSKVEIFL